MNEFLNRDPKNQYTEHQSQKILERATCPSEDLGR
jgi:hypothetical protein